MQTVFIILIVIGAILGLILLIAAFVRKAYSVYREIIIDQPKEVVFEYIRHLKNQDHYSKWVMTDPGMKKTYTGTDGEEGFIYAWDGNKQAGKGEQEIISLEQDSAMDIEVRFERPMPAVGHTPFHLEDAGSGKTRVTWGMSSSMRYPMNFMLLVVNFEKMLGRDIEISLQNLKKILESK